MIRIQADRQLIARGGGTRVVALRLQAPQAPPAGDRAPIDLALVLDRSGSMAGRKFELARKAAARALRLLHPDDRFALVVFDDEVNVVAPAQAARPEAVALALASLRRVEPRGSTDLCAGWLQGCEQAVTALTSERMARCLLLTDGLANVGVTDPSALVELASRWHARGVVTTAFGVGSDFDEELLQKMALAARGHFYFIEEAAQVPDLLTSELGETLEVVARDVAVHVRVPDGAHISPLSDHSVVAGPAADTVSLPMGDLTSGELVDVVFELGLPGGPVGADRAAEIWVSDREHVLAAGLTRLVWMVGSDADVAGQPRVLEVDRLRAVMEAARARREAAAANRGGRFEEAARWLHDVAAHIRRYAEGDREILTLADALDLVDADRYAAPMSGLERKRRHFEESLCLQSRAAGGRARKGH